MKLPITSLKNKLVALIALTFAAVIALSNAAGTIASGHGGRTGASFDTSSCSGCHTTNTVAYAGAAITVQLLSGSSPVTSYIPGASYTLQIRVASASITSLGYHYGFQTVCVKAGSPYTDVAGWGTLPGVAHSLVWNTRTYVEQSATILSTTTPFVSIPWTAPTSGTGSVTFYSAGCLVNNNHLPTGDTGITNVLTITESAGCVPATLDATPTNMLCYGYSDGSIGLTATGGTGAIGYSWTGPAGYTATTENISGLSVGGTYTVVVTSTGGCTDTTTATITEPAQLTATITATPVCPGATLTFTDVVTGGTGGFGSFSYTWSGPNSFTSFLIAPSVAGFSTLDTGVYSVTIEDLASCTFTTTLDVGILAGAVISLGPDTGFCPGGSVILGDAVSGQTYLWSTTATTSTITATDTGYYSVTATNSSSGCHTSDTVHVSLYPVPAISLGPNTTLCPGDTITLGEVLTGDTYLWNTTATSATIAVTDTGYYSVMVTNNNGCSSNDTVYIGPGSCDTGTSVRNIAMQNAISLYPNPANDFVNVTCSGSHNLQQVIIYDELGNNVYDARITSGTTQQHIDLSRFSAGVYSVMIKSDIGQATQELVITR